MKFETIQTKQNIAKTIFYTRKHQNLLIYLIFSISFFTQWSSTFTFSTQIKGDFFTLCIISDDKTRKLDNYSIDKMNKSRYTCFFKVYNYNTYFLTRRKNFAFQPGCNGAVCYCNHANYCNQSQ